MFAYFCRDVVFQYGIRNNSHNSHTNTSLSNVYKHSSKGFIRMDFKLTNILFNVKTNALWALMMLLPPISACCSLAMHAST